MDDIMANINDYFVRRHPSCCYMGPAGDWPNTRPWGDHYRCPICGEQYKPFHPGSDGRLLFNKVFVLGNDEDEGATFLPYWWADTAEDNLMQRFKEISHDID